MDHIVGIGGHAVAGGHDDVIKTFALSTCVGLVYYSIRKRVMGMAHIQLPSARAGVDDATPARYADTAPAFLVKEMVSRFGLTSRELLVSLYGGVDAKSDSDCFKIGEKNLVNVKAALRAIGLVYSDVDTGGQDSRTLVAYVSSGIVEVIKRPMAFRGIIPSR